MPIKFTCALLSYLLIYHYFCKQCLGSLHSSILHLSSRWNCKKTAGSRWTCFGARWPRTLHYPIVKCAKWLQMHARPRQTDKQTSIMATVRRFVLRMHCVQKSNSTKLEQWAHRTDKLIIIIEVSLEKTSNYSPGCHGAHVTGIPLSVHSIANTNSTLQPITCTKMKTITIRLYQIQVL